MTSITNVSITIIKAWKPVQCDIQYV